MGSGTAVSLGAGVSVTSGGPEIAVDVALAGAGNPVGAGGSNDTIAVGEGNVVVGAGFGADGVGMASIDGTGSSGVESGKTAV